MARTKQFGLPQFFQTLGDTTRLGPLNLTGEGGPQPKLSRHLAYLRNAGIASARREGKWMRYRIAMRPH